MRPAQPSLVTGAAIAEAAALDVLTAAFADDPLIAHLLPGPRRQERSRPFFAFLLAKSRLLGEELIGLEQSGRLLGVASVEQPGARRPSLGQLGRFGLACLRLLVKIGPRSFARLNGYMRATLAARPTTPHHYLVFIGVDPAAQGAGHGRRLLTAIHDRAAADPRSQGVALDTEQPANVPLYQRFGYQLTATTAAGPLAIYCMQRAT